MLKKRLGIECIEMGWKDRIDFIYDYYKIPPTLIIPKGVESIGDYTFCASVGNCYKLKEVVIPKGCVCIGRDAFDSCWGLKRVEIPKSVESIGEDAFYCCVKAEVILRKPKSKFSGNSAFGWCKSVMYVKEKTRT